MAGHVRWRRPRLRVGLTIRPKADMLGGMSRLNYPPLVIENERSSVLEVMIECYPDRYLLPPGDKMAIEADPDGNPFTLFVEDDGGLTIFPGNTAGAAVSVNGVLVDPDWDTPS